MKKQLNEEAIINELRGNSAFLRDYQRQPDRPGEPATPLPERAPSVDNRPGGEATARRGDRATGSRRILVRRGFEFYEDQLAALKKLSLQEQLDGQPGSMSQMMREALDDYLKKRSRPAA